MGRRVGFAGLGIMGQGMARNLLEKGYLSGVWNRTPKRCEPFAARTRVAATPRELAEISDVVVTCVSDPAAVERVVFADDGILVGARPGFRYVEASTVSPDLTRRIAAAMRSKGAEAIDAPVTGSKPAAAAGTLLFMTGGRPEIHAELEPVLLAMGSRAIHCGDSGQGSLMKLINNTIISFLLEGLSESAVVARKGGLPLEKLLEVVAASGYASPLLAAKGKAILTRDFDTQFSVDLLVKDQGLMMAEAQAQKTPLPGLAAIREAHQAARAMGLGQEDIAAVVKVAEKAAGIE
jgi:3-hydroxyisobutyrate dehydrogenase